jgi:O-antigen/teichoic acid export membrane protein
MQPNDPELPPRAAGPASQSADSIRLARTGSELARGAGFNLLALLASNLRAIFTFLIARLLGKSALGTFALAWAATDMLSKLGTFGLDNATLALVARSQAAGDPARSRQLLQSALAWGLAFSCLAAAIGIAAAQVLGRRFGQPAELVDAACLLLLALPGVALYRISNGGSRGMKVMDHDIYSRGLTESLGSTAALLVAFALGLRDLAPVVAALFGTGASGIVAFLLVRTLFEPTPASVDAASVRRELLGFSAPIALYSLLNILIMRLDVLLLGFFVGRAPGVTIEVLGIYSAAVEIAGGLRKVRQAFEPIFTPVVASQAIHQDRAAMLQTLALLGRWLLALVLPALCVFFLAGGLLLSIFGPGFDQGWPWLVLIGVASGLNAFAGLAEIIIMVEHPKLNLLNSGVAAACGLGASVFLISRLGPLGAAIGTLVPYSVQALLRAAELRLLFGWSWETRSFRRPVMTSLAAFVPACAVLAGGTGWAWQLGSVMVFLAGYLGAWRMLGLEPADRLVLRELRGRRSGRSNGGEASLS